MDLCANPTYPPLPGSAEGPHRAELYGMPDPLKLLDWPWRPLLEGDEK